MVMTHVTPLDPPLHSWLLLDVRLSSKMVVSSLAYDLYSVLPLAINPYNTTYKFPILAMLCKKAIIVGSGHTKYV